MARTYADLDVDSDFEGHFPYESKRVDVGGVKMAYVDEGPRDAPITVLMLHGNPTWGFLYRRFIERLWNRYRVVVPDHIGFGRSDKPESPDYYGLERHIRNLDALVKHLDLHNVVLCVHDWGGPIGMGWATRDPQRLSGFVVLNTWAFVERPEMRLPWLFRFLFHGKRGWRRITRKNFFTEYILGRGGTARRLEPAELDAYRAPHPTVASRTGAARFPALIPQTHDVSHEAWSTMKNIEAGLVQFVEHPALIVWAMRDVAFRKAFLERWKEVFPAHTGPVLLPNAKHYLQEDAPGEILQAIENFLANLPATQTQVAPVVAVAPWPKAKSLERSSVVAPKTVTPLVHEALTGPGPAPMGSQVEPATATRPTNGDSATPPTRVPSPVASARPSTGPPENPSNANPVNVQAETILPPPAAPKPAPSPTSHLVQDRNAKDVKRVPKRDAARIDDKQPRVAKPRVRGRKNGTVAVKRTQRGR